MKHKRWLAAAGIALLTVTGTGYWVNEYRKESLADAVNPLYWIRRAKGEDLYDSSKRVLFHGNRALPEVALTIDDGPHEPTGEQLLDELKTYGVRATFFIVGRRLEQRPDLVRRMIAEGHEVGNHTMDHYRLDTLKPALMRREVNDCDISFFRYTGRHLTLMRPPGERYNAAMISMARQLGYTIILHSDASKDFLDVSPDFILNRTLRRVENGTIILLHDDRPSTVSALPRIILALRRQGYKFVTVSEMLAHLPHPVIVETDANAPQTRTSAGTSLTQPN